MLAAEWDFYVGGHFDKTGTKQDVRNYQAYALDALRFMSEALAAAPLSSVQVPPEFQSNGFLVASEFQRTVRP